MKFLVIVKASKTSEAGEMPDQALLEAMGRYNEQLVKAGVIVAGEGLHPSSKGKRVRFDGDARAVIDGPFAQTQELVAGFWIWNCKSMDEAVEWLKQCPNPHPEACEVEIRQILSPEDFGDAMTPELKAQEDRLREQSARNANP